MTAEHKCDARPSRRTRVNQKHSAAFAEAREAFLESLPRDFGLRPFVPFVIRCRDCPGKCSFQKNRPQASVEDWLMAFGGHFKAVDVGAEAKEARELKQKTEALETRLEKEQKKTAMRETQDDHKLKAAKVMEQNSQQLISEQLAVNTTLLQETARLKQKLGEAAEAAQAPCVICRDAAPSRAFVPCGHVCLCSSCWARFEQNGGGRCPKCRQDVQFSFPVFI